jgi:hypothetical protein
MMNHTRFTPIINFEDFNQRVKPSFNTTAISIPTTPSKQGKEGQHPIHR